MMRANLVKSVMLLLLLFLGGCAGTGEKYHDPQMDFGAIQSVAVMPFANLTRDTAAAERVRDTFSTMLLATGSIYVIPPGETARGISRAGITDATAPSSEDVKKFAGIVSVDGVITGVIREYGEVRAGSAVANTITLSVRMLDKETGSVVWAAESSQGGITFTDRLFGGGGEPMDEVTREAVDDLLDKLFE